MPAELSKLLRGIIERFQGDRTPPVAPYYKNILESYLADTNLRDESLTARAFPGALATTISKGIEEKHGRAVAFGITIVALEAAQGAEMAIYGLPLSDPKQVFDTYMRNKIQNVAGWLSTHVAPSYEHVETADEYVSLITDLFNSYNDQ